MIQKFRVWDKKRKTFRTDIYLDCLGQFFKFSKKTPYGKAITYTNDKNMEISYSTGLKDKCGVEIYEGDIIKPLGFASWKGVVRYCDKTGAFILDDHDNDFIRDENVYLSQFTDSFEILGNIYENKELLESL